MRIKTFSEKTGLSADTLRYYEKEGLLSPERDDSGYRCYTNQDVRWVAFILRLKETEMPLAQIKTYAALRIQGDRTIAERYQILLEHQQKLLEKQRILTEHQTHLNAKLEIYREMLDKQNTEPMPNNQ